MRFGFVKIVILVALLAYGVRSAFVLIYEDRAMDALILAANAQQTSETLTSETAVVTENEGGGEDTNNTNNIDVSRIYKEIRLARDDEYNFYQLRIPSQIFAGHWYPERLLEGYVRGDDQGINERPPMRIDDSTMFDLFWPDMMPYLGHDSASEAERERVLAAHGEGGGVMVLGYV